MDRYNVFAALPTFHKKVPLSYLYRGAGLFLVLFCVVCRWPRLPLAALTGLLLGLSTSCAHNWFHQRDSQVRLEGASWHFTNRVFMFFRFNVTFREV
jgi:hypothetical protein